MNDQSLKLNRETGKYELTFKVSVEAEIFRRMLFRYIEENNVDVTSMEAYQKALETVARAEKWLNHPHATIITTHEQPAPPLPVQPARAAAASAASPRRADSTSHVSLTREAEEVLRERALELPIDAWETLLTPLASDLPRGESQVKDRIYRLRYAERRVLDQLKRELETPLNMERVEAIAAAVNSNGHK